MEAHKRPGGKEALQQRRRALLQELDAVHRQIAQAKSVSCALKGGRRHWPSAGADLDDCRQGKSGQPAS
jgi:hypothetical protein